MTDEEVCVSDGHVSQEWFDDFNQQCDREERQTLRDWGCPIDDWHKLLEDRTVVLVGYQENKV